LRLPLLRQGSGDFLYLSPKPQDPRGTQDMLSGYDTTLTRLRFRRMLEKVDVDVDVDVEVEFEIENNPHLP